jgi:CheY-like chemotaxis protein
MQAELSKLILIVDDSVDSQTLLKLLFKAKGYEVQSAFNGQEALVILRDLTVLPDLILLDAHMPVMDGYQFRRMQKMLPRLADIPVVVMTGESEHSVDSKMMQPRGILIKPLQAKSLVERVAAYL